MKFHALILRILITLGVVAYIASEFFAFGATVDSAGSWGFWLGEAICLVCLFLPLASARMLGAGGIFGNMLGYALFSLHDITNFFPTGSGSGISFNMKLLHAFLALLLTAASAAVVIWEVHQLQHPKLPADPEEPEFTRDSAWDESRPQ